MQQHSRFLLSTLLFVGAVCTILVAADAADEFYTIQTGTYTPAALSYAEKQFDMLAASLPPEDLAFLRIEQGTKYYIVRIGKFAGFSDAERMLAVIRPLAADAFILKDRDFPSLALARRYEEKPPAAAASAEQAPKEYYSLHLGNFLSLKQAQHERDSLAPRLSEQDRAGLRVSQEDEYFSLRLGAFATYADARSYLDRNRDMLPAATIMKERSGDGRMTAQSGAPASATTEAALSPGHKAEGGRGKARTDEEQRKEAMDALVADISAQYYAGQYGKAAELLRSGIARWPDNPDLLAWYGATLLNMRFPDKALDQYRKAVELSPDVPDFHAGVGHSLLNMYMERAKESIDSFNRALEIDPYNVSALEGLGFVYVSIGRTDLATDLYGRLLELDGNAAARLYQAITQGIDWNR